jgi:hypothetical protein
MFPKDKSPSGAKCLQKTGIRIKSTPNGMEYFGYAKYFSTYLPHLRRSGKLDTQNF